MHTPGKSFVFNRRFLAMAEYPSKLELCSFGLTRTFFFYDNLNNF